MTKGINDTKSTKAMVGSRIQAARGKMSRQQLVDILNNREDRPVIKDKKDTISLETLKQWEYGNNPVNLEWLPVICNVLSCDVGYLFGEYEEKQREISDVCAFTGLSEKAAKLLYQLHHNPQGSSHQELGVQAKGYIVPNVSVLNRLIEADGYLEFINEISFYLIYGGVLPDDAYTSDEEELSLQEYERFFKWANGNGREIVLRKEVCEMHLQRASDELKNIFREVLKKEGNKRATQK